MITSAANDLSLRNQRLVPRNVASRSTSQQAVRRENNSPSSEHLEAYLSYFSSIEEKVAVELSKHVEVLAQQGIKVRTVPARANATQLTCSSTPLLKIEYGGAVVTYTVKIGQYEMPVTMLNLPYASFKGSSTRLGQGSFGVVMAIPHRQDWVSKRIYFRDRIDILKEEEDNLKRCIQSTTSDLRDVLVEYGFFRICSALGIGPYVSHGENFDLICYNDCVEFLMERCQPMNLRRLATSAGKLKQRLDFCVRMMHKLHLLHKDIKPDNIMFSHYWNDYVLVDFGISAAVEEDLGKCTLAYREGTRKYMSLEMYRLSKTKADYVDLYYNDLNCLQLTLKEVANPIYNPKVFSVVSQELPGEIDWYSVFQEVHRFYRGEAKVVRTTHERVNEALINYFPLNVNQGTRKQQRWNIDLLVRAAGIVPHLGQLIQKCDQKDLKVIKINDILNSCYGMRILNLDSVSLIQIKLTGEELMKVSSTADLLLLQIMLMRTGLQERNLLTCQQAFKAEQESMWQECTTSHKYQILIQVLAGDKVEIPRLMAIRQKISREEFWWMLFHAVRLALEGYQLNKAFQYSELLLQCTYGRILPPKANRTSSCSNKHLMTLQNLHSVLLRHSYDEDELRWWRLCSFLVKQLIKQGRCKQAIQLSEQYIEEVSVQYRYFLNLCIAKAHKKINDLQLALSYYLDCLDTAQQLYSEGSVDILWLMCRIADLYNHLSLPNKAKELTDQIAVHLQKIVKPGLQHIGIYQYLAMIYVRMCRQDKAKALTEETLKIPLLNINEYHLTKMLYYRAAYFYESACYTKQPVYMEEAALAFTTCRDSYLKTRNMLACSYYMESLYYIGMCCLQTGNYQQAVLPFQECVDYSEGKCNNHQARIKCLYRMITCFRMLNDPALERSTLEKIHSILSTEEVLGDGFNSEYQMLILSDHLKQEQPTTTTKSTVVQKVREALTMAQNNRTLNQKQLSTMINVGKRFFKKQMYQLAVKCFGIGYDQSPQCTYYIGMCLFEMGAYYRSQSLFQDYVEKSTGSLSESELVMLGNSLRCLAEISKSSNDIQTMQRYLVEAIEVYLRVKSSEHLCDCYRSIGLCKYMGDNCLEAIKWFVRSERCLGGARLNKSKSFDYDIAMCYSRLKLYGKCHRHLTRWLMNGQENAQGLYHQAKCSLLLKKTRCFIKTVNKLPSVANSQHYSQLLSKLLQADPLKLYLAFGGDLEQYIVKHQLQTTGNGVANKLRKLCWLKQLLRGLKGTNVPTRDTKSDILKVSALLRETLHN